MKLVRFGPAGKERPGILDASGEIRDVSHLTKDWSGEALDIGFLAQMSQLNLSELPVADKDSRIGCPIARPGKMVCVGLNYADHTAEAGFDRPDEPLVFFKSPTALSGPFDPIILPRTATAVDWEVELAVVIGAVARNVQPDEAVSVVAGFAVVNDVTDRQWQFERGGQWGKAKSADTFAPLGPWLVTPDELPASLDMKIWLNKNGRSRQNSRTSQLVFTVDQVISHLSEFMTLVRGDVVLTGTPFGVAYNKPEPDFLKEGDSITCGIEGLGLQEYVVTSKREPAR